MADDCNSFCDTDTQKRGEDVILNRVDSLEVFEAVKHPTEVSLFVEEIRQE